MKTWFYDQLIPCCLKKSVSSDVDHSEFLHKCLKRWDEHLHRNEKEKRAWLFTIFKVLDLDHPSMNGIKLCQRCLAAALGVKWGTFRRHKEAFKKGMFEVERKKKAGDFVIRDSFVLILYYFFL